MKSLLALLALAAGTTMAQNPAITEVLNNYRLANNGILAPGAIFIVKGSNLADQETDTLQSVPLQRTLKGVEIRIAVNGVTTVAPLYYALNFQLAGIVPSNTPAGRGFLTVINNGKSSIPVAIEVVASFFGMLTVNGAGTGLAAVHDPAYVLLSENNAGSPGMNVVFYGSGLGAVTDDETMVQTPRDLRPGISVSVSIGGVNATVLYAGRTIYPGLDQINVTIPALNAYSCAVAVIITTNGQAANAGTIPVAQSGTTCTNSGGGGNDGGGNGGTGITQSEINGWISKGFYTIGSIGTGRSTSYTFNFTTNNTTITKQDTFSAQFSRISGIDLTGLLHGEIPPGLSQYFPQVGGCVVYSGVPANPYPNLTYTFLDAGAAITANGPNGTQVAPKSGQQVGGLVYSANNVPDTYLSPGRYTFTGPGGPDVGAFTGTLDVDPEFVVTTSPDEFKNIDRTKSLTVRWTGGDPNTTVEITGFSFPLVNNTPGTNVVFFCLAQNTAGQFTVPASVLSQLPASGTFSAGPVTIAFPGSFAVATANRGNRVSIPNIDYGTAAHSWGWAYTPLYK